MNYTYFDQLLYYSEYYNKQSKLINFFQITDREYLCLLFKQYHLEKLIKPQESMTISSAIQWVYELLLQKNYYEDTINFKNTIEMIEFSKNKKYTLNCYCHACLLKDVLNSIGFYSRIIYCLPIDCNFYGNHVILEYYSQEHQKWVMVDPTYNYIFYNCNGKPISLIEFRNCIISKQEIIIKNNNRFAKSAAPIHQSNLKTFDYKQMMLPLLIVLQYEQKSLITVQYRLVSKRYLPAKHEIYSSSRLIYTQNTFPLYSQ